VQIWGFVGVMRDVQIVELFEACRFLEKDAVVLMSQFVFDY